jgi:hypothetical protein
MAVTKILRTYQFRDKDPVVDELRTLVQDEGLYSKKNLRTVATLSNLAPATLEALFFGATRRPQNATVMAIATSLGYERAWRKGRRLNVEKELEVARAWNKQERKRQEGLRNGKGKN